MSTRLFRPLVWMCLLALLPALPSFAAEEEVFSLGEVIVTGEQQVVNLATTVTEVTAEDIKQRGAQTVGDALELLPGVDVQRGMKGAFVSVRGFDQGDLKILMDGVPVYEQYFRSFDLDQIPADSIAKITVVKGASSVLYGANTQGGVVNIITKKASGKPSASVDTAWGDYGTERYGVSFGAPAGPFNYWAGYTYRHSNGWRLSSDYDEDHWAAEYSEDTKDDGGARDDSGYLQHSFLAKVGYEPSADTKLYLTFNYLKNEKGIPSDSWYYTDYDHWQVSLVGEQRINDWLRIKARGYYVDHEDTLLQKDYIYGAPSWDSRGWFLESAYDNYTVGGEVQGLMDFGRWSFVKLGFSYIHDDMSQQETGRDTSPDPALVPPVWVNAGEMEGDTYTMALEDEIKVTDWLSFVAGASYDHYKPEVTKPDSDYPDGEIAADSMDAFNPQAGVVVTLSEQTALHGSVGRKTRFPHLKELYSKNGGGNPDLKEQRTTAYEVGVTHAFNDDFNGSIAFFYNDIKDKINRLSKKDPYENMDEANVLGVECALNADITINFWVGVNYTYLNTEDEETDQELVDQPRHRANLDARYRFPFGLAASAQLSYTNRQYYDKEIAPKTDERKMGDDFLLLNARLEQRLGEIWGLDGKVFVEVSNITDRDYTEGGDLMPGRNFLAGLNFTY